jgi:hypothetical protein
MSVAQRLRRQRLLVLVVAALMVLSLVGVASVQLFPQVTGAVGAIPSQVIQGVATATP